MTPWVDDTDLGTKYDGVGTDSLPVLHANFDDADFITGTSAPNWVLTGDAYYEPETAFPFTWTNETAESAVQWTNESEYWRFPTDSQLGTGASTMLVTGDNVDEIAGFAYDSGATNAASVTTDAWIWGFGWDTAESLDDSLTAAGEQLIEDALAWLTNTSGGGPTPTPTPTPGSTSTPTPGPTPTATVGPTSTPAPTPTPGPGGASLSQYFYDSNGIRVRENVDGQDTIYVGQWFELDSDGTVRTNYYAGGELVATSTDKTDPDYLFTDQLGSVVATTSPAVGDQNRFHPFGEARDTLGITETDQAFTGQRSDTNTGLYYYNARYYDPLIGRFTQPDTIIPNPANPQDLNRYSYVRNNPLRYTDPSGREVCFIEGDRAGQCYEAADGEDSAQTREEDAATVKILSDGFDFNGNPAGLTNVRYTKFGGLSGQQIIDSTRGGANPGDRTGAELRQFRIGQLTLDRDNARINVGNLTWVAIATEVNKTAPTVGFVASGVCLIGGPSNPVGGTGCGVALVADGLVALTNGAAAVTCATEGCVRGHIRTGAFAVTGAVTGAGGTDPRRAAAFVWDAMTTSGSYQDRFVGDD